MPVASDVEVFGPALSVIPVEGTAEAVATANASRYGLSGSVFWRDVSRARAVAMALDTGQVVIRGTGQYPRRGGAVWRLQAERDRSRGPLHQAARTGAEQKHLLRGGRVFGPPVSGFRGARLVVSLLIGAGVVRSVPFGSSQGGDGWRLKRGYSVASVGASRSPTSGAFSKPVS